MIASGDELGICPVRLAEFFAGIPPAERERWHRWLASLSYWAISQAAAVQAGKYRYDYARRGIALAIPDVLTAAVAREYGALVITDTAQHVPMPDVETRSIRVDG